MTPIQAWLKGKDENGFIMDFDSIKALQRFRQRLYQARTKLREEIMEMFVEAVGNAEGKGHNMHGLGDDELPTTLTGLEGLITLNHGPTSLWIGPNDNLKAQGIKGIRDGS